MVERHTIAWYTALIPLFVASLTTFHQIYEHLHKNPSHKMRKYMIRVILMVPIYALESYLSLRFNDYSEYFGVLRELYEAFVVYSFFQFLQIYLKGEENCVKLYDSYPKKQKHLMPFCCLPQWKTGKQFFYNTKYGTFQYVYLRTACAIIQLVLIGIEHYEESFSYSKPYVYIILINNFSQIWAIYCLALFYLGFHDDLNPMKPVPKFMSIKMIVFFTWWQSIGLSWLKSIGVIKATNDYSSTEIVLGLQDYIICWEMLAAAIAHRYVFKYSDFPPDDLPKKSKLRALASAVNVVDVLVPKAVKNKLKRTGKKPMLGQEAGSPGESGSPEMVSPEEAGIPEQDSQVPEGVATDADTGAAAGFEMIEIDQEGDVPFQDLRTDPNWAEKEGKEAAAGGPSDDVQ